MRNLFLFIWRYNYFLLFIILETVCFLLVTQARSYQSTTLLNSTNAVSTTLYSAIANTKEYLSLKDQNEKLALEHAYLYNKLKSAYDIIPLNQNEVKDTLYRQKYKFIAAKVINNTVNLPDNFLTLNVGSNQGVVEDMGVFNSEGIVGVTKNVSANFTSCRSFLHQTMSVASRLKDGSTGNLRWAGKDSRYAVMTDVPTHARILIGDTVVTSTLTRFFPEGIKVGIVEHYERLPNEPYFTVKIRLLTNFSKLNHVYVVINLFKREQDSLEQASQKPLKKK
jgi:rod shape-determining protein MreC